MGGDHRRRGHFNGLHCREELEARYGLGRPGGADALDRESAIRAGAEYSEIKRKWPGATVSDLIDHIDYAVALMGIDHVGIASDFQGGGGVEGWADAGETANLTAALRARGYGEGEVAKLWGGNLLRVMEAAEAGRIRP